MTINTDQRIKLMTYLKKFLESPTVFNGENNIEEEYHAFDEKRLAAIPTLRNSIDEFLSDKIDLKKFKEKNEIDCRKFPFWGFKNFSGQMQLNLYVNNIQDSDKEVFLRRILSIPKNTADACEKIDQMADYIAKQRTKAVNRRSFPWVSQIFMLSYFWGIQDFTKWPVYYGSNREVLINLGFPLNSDDFYGKQYSMFIDLIQKIENIYTEEKAINEKFPLWFIEHVLTKNRNAELENVGAQGLKIINTENKIVSPAAFGEWIPPIIDDLEDLAFNRETEWSKRRSLKPEKAFETKLGYAFTLLGFEVTELGQGSGREPDGVAISFGANDGDYAIVYDAKARESKYGIGTSDREMYEYIQKKKDEFRRERIYKIYFLIISSAFDEAANLNLIRDIYRKTQVRIIFLKASDLLFIVEAKLKNPEIDHSRLEFLFLEIGALTREKIINELG